MPHLSSDMFAVHDSIASINTLDDTCFARLKEEWNTDPSQTIRLTRATRVCTDAMHCRDESAAAHVSEEVTDVDNNRTRNIGSRYPVATCVQDFETTSWVLVK